MPYADPEKGRAYRRAYYVKHKERLNAKCAKWRMENPVKRKATIFRHRYGLELAELEAMKSGGCVLCGSHRYLCVDHDHDTGVVRGILCHRHNIALGSFDGPEQLRRAAEYLEAKR